jgi:hypothetical protein
MNRQGDILIVPCKSIPARANKVEAVNGRYILALGEATGHSHTIEATPEIELYEKDGVLYCRTAIQTEAVHQEHGPQSIPVGISTIIRQRTWTSGMVRPVMD